MSSWIHWSGQSHLTYFAERIKNLYIWIQVICEHELPDLPNWKTIHIICTCAQLDCSACWIQFRITRFDWQEQPWSSFLMIKKLPSCLPFQEEFQQRGQGQGYPRPAVIHLTMEVSCFEKNWLWTVKLSSTCNSNTWKVHTSLVCQVAACTADPSHGNPLLWQCRCG
jgi:hypothetical protein